MPPVSKIQFQAEARIADAEEAEIRKRAARQAAANIEVAPIEYVKARVLPMGDGKVSMGVHAAGIGDAYYDKGETIEKIERPVAEALELRGFVEIIED